MQRWKAATLLVVTLLGGCSGTSPSSTSTTVPKPTIAPAPRAAVALDPTLPYQAIKSNPVTYEVDFSAVVTAPNKTKVLKVWLPIPQSDSGQLVTEGELSSFPMNVRPTIGSEPVYGNKFAYFEFHNPQGGQIIRHKFKVKVWELRWNLEPAKIQEVKSWPAAFDKYRRGESQAVVVDDRFDKLISEVVPQRGNPLNDMTTVMDWTIKNFKYQHGQAASLQASSVNALQRHSGHCSDYHGFCSAMGRVLGTPTRVTYGINPFPKNSPSHCKMEAFLPPYGWVSFDVSETQNLISAINSSPDLDAATKQNLVEVAKRRLLLGFRDNTWFMQTRGTDYDLEPKAAKRAPVVRTIYVEADGVQVPDVDSADKSRDEFTWMTVQSFIPDKPVTYTFTDYKSLMQTP